MNVLDIFKRVDESKREKVATGWNRYKQLLVAAANDIDDIDPAEVEESLEEVGKNRDDFEADVKLMVDRLLWGEQLRQRPELEKRLSEIQKMIVAADAEFELARQKHQDAVEPLQIEYSSVTGKLGTAQLAEINLLRKTLDDPSTARLGWKSCGLAECSFTAGQRPFASNLIQTIRLNMVMASSAAWKLSQVEDSIRHEVVGRHETALDGTTAKDLKAKKAEWVQHIDGIRKQLSEIEKQQAEVEEQTKKLSAEKLQP